MDLFGHSEPAVTSRGLATPTIAEQALELYLTRGLSDTEGMTADEVAERLQLHPLQVRPVLTRLAQRGLVAYTGRQRPSSTLKAPQRVYILAAKAAALASTTKEVR